nr:hypothetical protein [Tanacetum cinerariifolium]
MKMRRTMRLITRGLRKQIRVELSGNRASDNKKTRIILRRDLLSIKAQFDAFTDFEAQQHHDQATGGSLIYEHPPIPNPATPPVSTTEGAAEVPFTIDQMLALFPMCLQKIDALEKELKATKKLNRDTVFLFHKRIKKLEAKVKTKSKRKLVISDSEEEEAAKDYAELEKFIYLAEAAVNEPSSFVTPSKTTAI